VIWGAFSTLFIGLCHWIVPRLCGVPLAGARWSAPLLWVWNLNVIAAVVLMALGWNRGWEAGELPLVNVLVLFAALLAFTAQCLVTIGRRREAPLYVSLWYLIAALVWTDANLVLMILGPDHIPGINNAAWHGLFIHYVVGLWITPAGYVLIYYFLPASVRNPIYSHKLSLIGFWSLAFFYPFVGIHHYLYSPIADWAETLAIVSSMMLIVPVWTVLQNFFGTMLGRWDEFGRNLPAKFLIVGSIMYLIGCTQGSLEALRSLQEPTHFTDFVVAHSHITVFGTFILWALAGALYVWPRVSGVPLWSGRLGNWGFWLVTLGISAMTLILAAQGLQQGFMLMAGAAWLDSLSAMRPYWWLRTLTGIAMDVGVSLLVINMLKRAPGAGHPRFTPDSRPSQA
jgi:cytochrome c oxidase cbb3-type subunit 1